MVTGGSYHTSTEMQNTSLEVSKVEGYIDPRKSSGKSTFECDIAFSFLSLLSLLKTRSDGVAEHFLHLLDAESLSQL